MMKILITIIATIMMMNSCNGQTKDAVVRPATQANRFYTGNPKELRQEVDGYLARVMQHEFDHLDGKVFTDRISPLRKQLIKSKLKALLQGRYRCGYRTKATKH